MGKQPQKNGNFTESHAQLLSMEALDTLNKVKGQLSEQSAAGALARGKVFELVGYFVEAADSYREALSHDRNNSEAAARLALSQIKAGHNEKALASAMTLAARDPGFQVKALATEERVSGMTILGDALVANNRLADAMEAYQAARKINARDSYAAGRIAELHLANDEPKKAIELRKDFGGNPRFHTLNSLLALGNTSAALLPTFTRDTLVRKIFRDVPGRPLLVDSQPRFAPIVEGDEGWCANPTE